MRILAVVNQRHAGPGVFEAAGADLDEWVPAESAPPELGGYGAVMAFGGSMHADQEDRHPWLGSVGDPVPRRGHRRDDRPTT